MPTVRMITSARSPHGDALEEHGLRLPGAGAPRPTGAAAEMSPEKADRFAGRNCRVRLPGGQAGAGRAGRTAGGSGDVAPRTGIRGDRADLV